ncbi:MAG: SDR family oxidoreductase [Actinomycetota bacterium]|nr:SDR family oxidoreductase [Actinomycetota bacterium]
MHSKVSSLFDLTGRVAIVTGSSRGLGRAIAGGLAHAGAAVVICSRKLDACIEAAEEIEADGGIAFPLATNMTDPAAGQQLVDATIDRFGRLDIVVNNAATVLDRPLDRVDVDTFNGAFGTNLLSPLLLVEAAKPYLAASGHGAIINILSIAMVRATPDRYYYPPIKAALAQATRSLAVELGPLGIRVNAISPGTFRTDMVTKAYSDDVLAQRAATNPLRKIGDPDELVGPALLLASDAGSMITGTVLTVDAGDTA